MYLFPLTKEYTSEGVLECHRSSKRPKSASLNSTAECALCELDGEPTRSTSGSPFREICKLVICSRADVAWSARASAAARAAFYNAAARQQREQQLLRQQREQRRQQREQQLRSASSAARSASAAARAASAAARAAASSAIQRNRVRARRVRSAFKSTNSCFTAADGIAPIRRSQASNESIWTKSITINTAASQRPEDASFNASSSVILSRICGTKLVSLF
jgi:hypothetical protein